MTTSRVRLEAAEAHAEALVASLDIRAASEIDLDAIAGLPRFNAMVQDVPMTGSVARLVQRGRGAVISVSTDVREPGRRRFAVAHELGHLVLHEGVSEWDFCSAKDLLRYEQRGAEPEANAFASALLMPKTLFTPRCQPSKPDLHIVASLATEFATTLTATALRFARFSRDRCAVVFSFGGKVAWACKSDGFNAWLRADLDPESYAGAAFRGVDPVDRLSVMPAEVWVDSDRLPEDAEIFEHTRWMPRYETALTLLWISPDAPY
ncbi:MAG: ImmA/IrrE family metallo-endopeptidase [Myxococcota bacterium]